MEREARVLPSFPTPFNCAKGFLIDVGLLGSLKKYDISILVSLVITNVPQLKTGAVPLVIAKESRVKYAYLGNNCLLRRSFLLFFGLGTSKHSRTE